MMTRATILKALTAGIAFTVLSGCGGGTDPNSPEYQAFKTRYDVMEKMGDALLPLNEMSGEERAVDEQEFLEAARTIASTVPMMLNGFDNQTLIPESRATAEIWANWDDFEARSQSLGEAADALVAATESGGFAGGRELVRPLREACGGCHRAYRGPEPD